MHPSTSFVKTTTRKDCKCKRKSPVKGRWFYGEKNYDHYTKKYSNNLSDIKKNHVDFIQRNATKDLAHKKNRRSEKFEDSYELWTNTREKRDMENLEDKWENVLQFHSMIFHNIIIHRFCDFESDREDDFGENMVKHQEHVFIHQLYNIFYKNEPKQYISRTNFEFCLQRKIHQFYSWLKKLCDQENLKKNGDSRDKSTSDCSYDYEDYMPELIRKINYVFDSFDTLGKNSIDWRQFLFMFHIASLYSNSLVLSNSSSIQNPNESRKPFTETSTQDLLLLGFRYYSTQNDDSKVSSLDKMKWKYMDFILYPLLLNFPSNLLSGKKEKSIGNKNIASVFLTKLDNAWIQIQIGLGSLKDCDHGNLGKANDRLFLKQETEISYHLLQSMVFHPIVQDFILENKIGGPPGRFIYNSSIKKNRDALQKKIINGKMRGLLEISFFEENYYPEALLNYIFEQRYKSGVKRVVLNRIMSLDNEKKFLSLHKWKVFALKRQRLRSIMIRILSRQYHRYISLSFLSLIIWTIDVSAAITIQRVGRGFLTRIYMRVHFYATLIQTRCRGLLGRNIYRSICHQRHRASIEIQRHVRGYIHRQYAFNVFTTYVEQEFERLRREREIWEMNRQNRAASAIQMAFRKKQVRDHEKREKERKLREEIIQQQMEHDNHLYWQERKIHEKQIEEYYVNLKLNWIKNNQVVAKSESENIKIRTLRRRLLKEEAEKKQKQMKDAMLIEMEENHKLWNENWKKTISEKVQLHKDYCRHCIDGPTDTNSEMKFGKKLKDRVKLRLKDVLHRADEKGIELEIPEGLQIAKEEIIMIEGREKEKALNVEKEEDFARLLKDEKMKEVSEEKARITQDKLGRMYAISVLCKVVRQWLARKSLRIRCTEVFEKLFDETYCMFYYRNKITGKTQWEKPKALGQFDIEAKNEWKVLRDMQNFPYYYNPNLMEMSWECPSDMSRCRNIVPYTWCRVSTLPYGRCPNIITKDNNNNNNICDECLLDQT